MNPQAPKHQRISFTFLPTSPFGIARIPLLADCIGCWGGIVLTVDLLVCVCVRVRERESVREREV